MASLTPPDGSTFVRLLREQVGHEFGASQQYVALAVWFDARDLPRLAAHFYRQAVEERNHALMLVQHMLDRDIAVSIPGVPDVRNDFTKPTEPIALALAQEQAVTDQIEALFAAARADGDFLGEQFMLWFLKEQVEEIDLFSSLLDVAERCRDRPLDLEQHIAREGIGAAAEDPTAPPVAGGG
jgi:bacterioferritin B